MVLLKWRNARTVICLRSLLFATLALAALCGCKREMTKEDEAKALAAFKGGPPGADEAAVQAKERATAEAYRKAHPEQFPPETK